MNNAKHHQGPLFVEGHPRLAFNRSGNGPAVIFLHGIGGNKSNWNEQLNALQDRFTAISWDARGYGQSDDYDGELNFSEFADDLVRLMDQLSIGQAHLVGLSMGGRILLDFQRRYSSRIATLTLCATHYSYQNALTNEQRYSFIRLRQQPLLEGKTFHDLAPALIKSLVGPNCSDEARAQLSDSIQVLRKDSYLKTIAASVTYEAGDNLADIDVPVQLIFSEYDTLTSPSIGQEMSAQIKGARLDVISDCGHLCNLEQPKKFNDILAAFLLIHADRASNLKG